MAVSYTHLVVIEGKLLPFTISVVHIPCSVFSDTSPCRRSIMAEYCLSISHPTSIENGRPLATRKDIVNVKPLLLSSKDTCFLTVLFCLPVAPMIVTLFIGRVGIGILLSCCSLLNSTWSIKDILDPVSIINVDMIPFIWALMYTISLFRLGIG